MIAAPETMRAGQNCSPRTIVAPMTTTDRDVILDRLCTDTIAARNDADRAADTLASTLRARVMAGVLQLEADDPAMLDLQAWHALDVQRAVLEGATARYASESRDRLARTYGGAL